MPNPPVSATLYITNHCQLSCNHCYWVDDGSLNTSHLKTNQIFNILKDFSENGVFMVVIAGGDPILHADFKKIISKMLELNILPLIGITGVNVDADLLKYLVSNNIDNIQVSIDKNSDNKGDTEIERVLGGKVEQNINIMMEMAIKVTVAITVYLKNINDAHFIINYLHDKGIYRIKISFWEKTTHGNKSGYSELSSEEKIKFLDEIDSQKIESGFVVSPGFQFRDKKHYVIDDSPFRLVIKADGKITTSEMSNPIGMIGGFSPIKIYTNYIFERSTKILKLIEQKIIKDFNIGSVWETPRDKINASGACIVMNKNTIIMVAEDLTPQEKLFVICHEVGHVKLGITENSPRYDIEQESIVNEWAVNYLEPYLSSVFHLKLLELAKKGNEKLLFKEIAGKMDYHIRNVDGYFTGAYDEI